MEPSEALEVLKRVCRSNDPVWRTLVMGDDVKEAAGTLAGAEVSEKFVLVDESGNREAFETKEECIEAVDNRESCEILKKSSIELEEEVDPI